MLPFFSLDEKQERFYKSTKASGRVGYNHINYKSRQFTAHKAIAIIY